MRVDAPMLQMLPVPMLSRNPISGSRSCQLEALVFIDCRREDVVVAALAQQRSQPLFQNFTVQIAPSQCGTDGHLLGIFPSAVREALANQLGLHMAVHAPFSSSRRANPYKLCKAPQFDELESFRHLAEDEPLRFRFSMGSKPTL